MPLLDPTDQDDFRIIGAPLRKSETKTVSSSPNNSSMDARFSCNICFEAVTEPVVTQCGHLYCWPCLYRWLEPGMYPAERVRLLGLSPTLTPSDSGRRSCPVCKAGCSVDTIVPIYVRAVETTASNNPSFHENETGGSANGSKPDLMSGTCEVVNDNEFSIDNIPSVFDDDFDNDEIDLQPEFTTGLRQRRSSTMDSQTSTLSDVPRRPAPQSPERAATTASPQPHSAAVNSGVHGTNTSLALSPALSIGSHNQQHHPQTASLSHGILAPFVQEAMRRSNIPSIHRPEGFNNPNMYSESMAESDPGATEFLSRLLLMLGSFVIMCLLIF